MLRPPTFSETAISGNISPSQFYLFIFFSKLIVNEHICRIVFQCVLQSSKEQSDVAAAERLGASAVVRQEGRGPAYRWPLLPK